MKGHGRVYPTTISTLGMKALYDNLGKNEALTIKVHQAVKRNAKDGWRK
jgi:type I restriction enzyme R subunit